MYTKLALFDKFSLGVGALLIGTAGGLAIFFPPVAEVNAPQASIEKIKLDLISFAPVKPKAKSYLKYAIGALTIDQVNQKLTYDFNSVNGENFAIPRIFVSVIPYGLAEIRETPRRKAMFFKSVLPLVLQVNEEIQVTRKRIQSYNTVIAKGGVPKATERKWLDKMIKRYKVKNDDIAALLLKVDVVPPSLALAQAAKESGWGSSRFAREANALFGQWTFEKNAGLVPNDRSEGKQHLVKKFDSLYHSVRAYAYNLNTHRAYRSLRALRADMRSSNRLLDGQVLAGGLHAYSEQGADYIRAVRSMIRVNKLRRLDNARLDQS